MRGRRLGRKILNRDAGHWIVCCWDECERSATTLYEARFHDHNPRYPCDGPGAKHVRYTFCSERHKQYFLHSHRNLWNLPAGAGNVL